MPPVASMDNDDCSVVSSNSLSRTHVRRRRFSNESGMKLGPIKSIRNVQGHEDDNLFEARDFAANGDTCDTSTTKAQVNRNKADENEDDNQVSVWSSASRSASRSRPESDEGVSMVSAQELAQRRGKAQQREAMRQQRKRLSQKNLLADAEPKKSGKAATLDDFFAGAAQDKDSAAEEEDEDLISMFQWSTTDQTAGEKEKRQRRSFARSQSRKRDSFTMPNNGKDSASIEKMYSSRSLFVSDQAPLKRSGEALGALGTVYSSRVLKDDSSKAKTVSTTDSTDEDRYNKMRREIRAGGRSIARQEEEDSRRPLLKKEDDSYEDGRRSTGRSYMKERVTRATSPGKKDGFEDLRRRIQMETGRQDDEDSRRYSGQSGESGRSSSRGKSRKENEYGRRSTGRSRTSTDKEYRSQRSRGDDEERPSRRGSNGGDRDRRSRRSERDGRVSRRGSNGGGDEKRRSRHSSQSERNGEERPASRMSRSDGRRSAGRSTRDTDEYADRSSRRSRKTESGRRSTGRIRLGDTKDPNDTGHSSRFSSDGRRSTGRSRPSDQKDSQGLRSFKDVDDRSPPSLNSDESLRSSGKLNSRNESGGIDLSRGESSSSFNRSSTSVCNIATDSAPGHLAASASPINYGTEKEESNADRTHGFSPADGLSYSHSRPSSNAEEMKNNPNVGSEPRRDTGRRQTEAETKKKKNSPRAKVGELFKAKTSESGFVVSEEATAVSHDSLSGTWSRQTPSREARSTKADLDDNYAELCRGESSRLVQRESSRGLERKQSSRGLERKQSSRGLERKQSSRGLERKQSSRLNGGSNQADASAYSSVDGHGARERLNSVQHPSPNVPVQNQDTRVAPQEQDTRAVLQEQKSVNAESSMSRWWKASAKMFTAPSQMVSLKDETTNPYRVGAAETAAPQRAGTQITWKDDKISKVSQLEQLAESSFPRSSPFSAPGDTGTSELVHSHKNPARPSGGGLGERLGRLPNAAGASKSRSRDVRSVSSSMEWVKRNPTQGESLREFYSSKGRTASVTGVN